MANHSILYRINHWLARLETFLLCLILLLLILLSSYQIGLRWFTSSGLVWLDPLLRSLVLWGGLLGAALATLSRKHIALDVFSYLVSDRLKRWFSLTTTLFSAMVSGLLLRAALLFVKSEMVFGGPSLFGIQSWVWYLIFPITLALITLHFMINLIIDISGPQDPLSHHYLSGNRP